MRIKVGIFFGGPSREREISFAGGRTVYDNLDKELFEAIPIFVDSFRKWYLLDWQYLYRGTIRDFFPPIADAPVSAHGFQVYQESLGPLDELALEEMGRKVGRRIRRHELPELIDVAFLALHGEYGEDGQLQRELEYAGIPYTGSGVRASEIGMDKALQKEMMSELGFPSPPIHVIENGDFDGERPDAHFAACVEHIGWPMVVRPARQGSSIGVAILREDDGREAFDRAVNAAFFREVLPLSEYEARDAYERLEYVRLLSDLRDGIAFPMDATLGERTITLYTPDELHDYLEEAVATLRAQRAGNTSNGHSNTSDASNDGTRQLTNSATHILLVGHQSEERVIVEGFIDGKEFSTIVVRTDDGRVVALPPTEIVKPASELFDYRSKYMPGRSRKVTPIELPTDRIRAIRSECERLYEALGFQVYARIDGFHTAAGEIFLNDPNTTSGMMPSSFFFHQAAEIGLNPSQFLTFIVRQSLRERGMPGEDQEAMEVAVQLGEALDEALAAKRSAAGAKERIAVLLGGVSFERHISVESGRNIYEKLASSENYRPVPLFLSTSQGQQADSASNVRQPHQKSKVNGQKSKVDYSLHQLPINLLLKDNADDIRDKLRKTGEHPVVAEIRRACAGITDRYADPDVVFQPREIAWSKLPELADGVFIALHGRPGEDGQVQSRLEPLGLYYNGSGVASSQITIDKHRTLEVLGDAGLPVTHQWLAPKEEFLADAPAFLQKVEARFDYPLIAKPVDDGCSSAVKLIKTREELETYCQLTFTPAAEGLDVSAARRRMKLSAKDEWPFGKDTILFEGAITAAGADKFLEITGGMLTHYGVDGQIRYEVFEPSETLAGGEVLSLEEKFLAGEGQNLTPARLGTEDYSYDYVGGQVRADLERAAKAVSVEGYCRIDAFVRVFADGRVETVPIEVNSLPGMTPATAIFHQAALAGYQPTEFIARILAYGKARRDRSMTVAPRSSVPTIASTAAPLAASAPTSAPMDNNEDNLPEQPENDGINLGKTDPTASEPTGGIDLGKIGDPLPPAEPTARVVPPAPTPTTFDEEGNFATTAFADNEQTTPSARRTSDFVRRDPPDGGEPDSEQADDRKSGLLPTTLRLLKSGYWWKNVAAALLFFVLCFFLLRVGMSWYTAHGKSTELPNFVGMQKVEAEEIADDLGLKLKFEKGAFDPNRPPGEVTLQHPKAGSGVKKNRSIYLTILNDEAPMIQLPPLVGNYDYTQYTTKLEHMADVRSKIREQVYDPKLEENTILHFYDGDTKVTDAMTRGGYQVKQGATLEFVVSVRKTGEVKVPDYKCKRFGTVEFLLDASDLLVGTIHGDVSDRSEAYVIRTEPPGGKMVPVGTKFDIYLSARRPDGCE